ncbi:ECF transporter S component [Natronincola ferrireducens]|uniref:ECF transporter S component, folate family n=1 Tax=Natronincola ferrireducens TaxID=393762 RepID=A0A1G8Y2L3_9FIRM|nr:ECF transporter S component [Natronincola ferrireducens]SDJ96290.1 hypothetical protein SAMN05660472_00388 [Natronincola ferrireducens]
MKKTTYFITRTSLLLSLALIFQIAFRTFAQPIVGPLINLILIISVIKVGVVSAVMIGCLTPLIAFLIGITPLLPLIPFIMIGNSIFAYIFNYFYRKERLANDYRAIIPAAFGKFIFLALSIRYLVTLFIPQVPLNLIAAFTWPQLYTALIGGFLAIFISKLLK